MGLAVPLRPCCFTRKQWTLRFFASGLSSASAPRANQPALGYTPEKSAHAVISSCLVTVDTALQSVSRMRLAPPKCCAAFRDRTSHEVLRPSGDVTCEVRLTRDFHPRHLPPLDFLSPPTASSFARLACLISYRHHLWGSKLKEQRVAARRRFSFRAHEKDLLKEGHPLRNAKRRTTQTAQGRLYYEYVACGAPSVHL
jgi:hypothetical protein